MAAAEVRWGGFKGSGYGRHCRSTRWTTTRAPSTPCTTLRVGPGVGSGGDAEVSP
ncbi:hypothetical protein ACFVZD_28390 [Streptomyces sp. NPDC058287]|uniref:hypothetical protein n=1 Tax=Streptomyces sp. NPDC058287 TaxID=3346423 RepID=UPI0036F0EFF6